MESVQAKPLFSTRALCALILPLMVEQLLAVTVGMADTMMVSRVGEAAVSGISLVDSVNVLLIQVFAALATGGAVVVSQYLGRRDRQSACAAARQLIWITALLATVIGAVVLVGNRWILQFVFGRVEPAVMENAMTYFWLSALSYPFIAVYNAGAALFRSMGNSKVSMMTSFIINIINIGGNAILIYGFHWGTAGAGTATLVSRAVAAVVMVVLLHHRNNPVYLEGLLRPYLDRKLAGSILKVGIPNGVENGMFQVGKLLVAGLISSFGTAAIAANAVCNSIAGFPIIPGSAIGLALITVVGQCVGAQRYEEAKQYIHKLTGLAYLFMFFFNALIAIFCSQIVGFFSLSAEATDTAVQIMLWHSLFCAVFWPAAFTMPNGLRAANDVRFTMTVSILSMWICRICMSYILGTVLGMGALGTWFAMFLDWIVRIVFFAVRLHSNKWQHRELQQKMAAVD